MYKILILIILLTLLILVYLKKTNFSEFFTIENSKIGFTCIDAIESKKVIESVVNYDLYNELDRSLRDIGESKSITKHYKQNLLDWNNNEIKILQWLCNGILEKTPKKYLFLFDKIRVAKYNDDVEVGFPHTQQDCIFFTGAYINKILPYYNNNDLDNCIYDIGLVVIHECVHIWQRRNKEFFNTLYKKWNFNYYNKIINFGSIRQNSRYNPDGTDLNWCYKLENGREFIPIALYKNDSDDIGNVDLVAVYIEKIGSRAIIPPIKEMEFLKDVNEYNKFFGNVGNNNYHPNELAAEIISRIIIKEMEDLKLNQHFTNHYNKYLKEKTMAEIVFNTMV